MIEGADTRKNQLLTIWRIQRLGGHKGKQIKGQTYRETDRVRGLDSDIILEFETTSKIKKKELGGQIEELVMSAFARILAHALAGKVQ